MGCSGCKDKNEGLAAELRATQADLADLRAAHLVAVSVIDRMRETLFDGVQEDIPQLGEKPTLVSTERESQVREAKAPVVLPVQYGMRSVLDDAGRRLSKRR